MLCYRKRGRHEGQEVGTGPQTAWSTGAEGPVRVEKAAGPGRGLAG